MHQPRERDLRFQTRQRGTDAKVNARAKRNVTIVGAHHVKTIRVREDRRVPIGRADHQEDNLALAHRSAGEFVVPFQNARLPLYGALVTQNLLDRRGKQVRIFLDTPELIRMAQ